MTKQIEEKAGVLVKLVDWMIESGQKNVDAYVEKIKELNPNISRDKLAKKIVNRKSFKNGLVGAATGIGGGFTFPVTIPTDLVLSWKIQIMMVLAIARVYGYDTKAADIKTDIYLILAGDSAKEALKRIGVEVGKSVTKKAIDRIVTRAVMQTIWTYIPRKIITKNGQKSLTSFMKMVPLVGAPIGFVFDWISAKTVGEIAIHYYSGGG